MMMLSQEYILEQLREWMEELFEIEPESIQLESNLYTDLDVDSIDAVDLVVKIKQLTGKQVKPEDFKNVRTVQDVVTVIQNMTKECPSL
ncbi:acyl carrier protein [Acinetobacter sp. MD2]|uniref:acyl carrier protein n=1 Tax=Acinetobacter sp. MD2 TaxID=2600066 RepID=UPI002D1F6DAF|nr:acyl carrier protein [Acinetobacter sp. MD2]MEB3767074.1 acyl carrier protein [Acinetobacter sp. MD2]